MTYNENNGYDRYDNRRPPRRQFRDGPDRPQPQVKLNGPHKAFNDISCEGGCGGMIVKDENFYFVNLLEAERVQKMCPNCTKEKIII